jgi:hypothetical protein
VRLLMSPNVLWSLYIEFWVDSQSDFACLTAWRHIYLCALQTSMSIFRLFWTESCRPLFLPKFRKWWVLSWFVKWFRLWDYLATLIFVCIADQHEHFSFVLDWFVKFVLWKRYFEILLIELRSTVIWFRSLTCLIMPVYHHGGDHCESFSFVLDWFVKFVLWKRYFKSDLKTCMYIVWLIILLFNNLKVNCY